MKRGTLLKIIWAIPVVIYLATIENPALSFNLLVGGCALALILTVLIGEENGK